MPSQDWIEANRAKWKYRGQERPPFALAPQPGQVSLGLSPAAAPFPRFPGGGCSLGIRRNCAVVADHPGPGNRQPANRLHSAGQCDDERH